MLDKCMSYILFILCILCGLSGVSSAAVPEPKGQQNTTSLYERVCKGVVNITSTMISNPYAMSTSSIKGNTSGFIIDKMGHVVTNASGLSDLRSIEVGFTDGQRWPAKLIGVDEETDIAVLEILAPDKNKEAFGAIPLASTSDIQPGQTVLAFGNPDGISCEVSRGIIMSPVKSVAKPDGTVLDLILRTDAMISSFNMGGPLVDTNGRVLGIISAAFAQSAQSSPSGFVISSEVIQNIASQLVSRGHIRRPWLGATLISVTPSLARALNLPGEIGVMIVDITPNGPAAKAGLKASTQELRIGNMVYKVGGDIIIAADNNTIRSDKAFLRFLQGKEPGDTIELTVYRDKKLHSVKVKLGDKAELAAQGKQKERR